MKIPAKEELSQTGIAYETILGGILDGRLKGGSRLQERRLASDLSLSRTPIREALGRLENEEMIVRQDRVWVVRTITLQDFLEILQVRKLLETEAVSVAVNRIPEAEIIRLQAAMADLAEAAHPDFRSFDEDLHGTILSHAANSVIASMVLQLRKKTAMFNVGRIPARTAPVLLEHAAILDALARRDQEGARQAVATHRENIRGSIVEWIIGVGRAELKPTTITANPNGSSQILRSS